MKNPQPVELRALRVDRYFIFGLFFLLVLCGGGVARANAVFDWLEEIPKLTANVSRSHAMRTPLLTELAVFNALNAITPKYEAYGPPLATVVDASPEAAVAAAVQTILANVPGVDAALLDKTYQEQLKKVTDASARAKGIVLGRRAAQALLALRVEDDFSRLEQTKRTPAAGVFELTPDHKMASSIASMRIRPYALARLADFDPGPPAAAGSAAALREVLEVKAVGARNSSTRSGDQTAAAIFWNSGEPNDSLPLLKAIAEKRAMSMLDTARMLALLEMADYDGGLVYVSFKDKYSYWRPYNAIRGKFAAPEAGDPQWEPLVQTPPNPDYPSGSGVGGGVLARFFETFNGDGAVPLTWKNGAIGVTRGWPNGEAMGRDLGYSRLWAGVHFRQSIEVGHKLGRKIFDAVLATQLKPLAGK